MDLEEDFVRTVKETVAALLRRGIDPSSYAYDDKTIVGWAVDSKHHESEKVHSGFWEEYWSVSKIVMCADGAFWECGYWESKSSRGNERKEFVTAVPLSRFIGAQGKPFAEWKAKLERLPYVLPA